MDLSGTKVLVIAGELATRSSLRHALEECGAAVSSAASVSMALDTIEFSRPDLIVTDFLLGQGGAGSDEELRAQRDGRLARIPILVLAGMRSDDDQAKTSFHSVLEKPGELDYLLGVIGVIASITPKFRARARATELSIN